jgi:hypothetical protein
MFLSKLLLKCPVTFLPLQLFRPDPLLLFSLFLSFLGLAFLLGRPVLALLFFLTPFLLLLSFEFQLFLTGPNRSDSGWREEHSLPGLIFIE